MKITGEIIGIILGVLLVIGTKCRWMILVDPPENLVWFYSHSQIKKLFGSGCLIPLNYFIGTMIFILSLLSLLSRIAGIES